jgi:hypothetical protein
VRGNDHGAVAVIVAIVLAFAMMPALALGTGSYVRSTTGTELQRASDSGALAGAAEIPLGDLNFAESYISQIQGTGGVVKTLQALGIQNYAQLPDPLIDACKVALSDATNSSNLADAYATYNSDSQPNSAQTADPTAWCKAVYLPDAGVLGSAQTCLNSISGLSTLSSGLGSVLSLLGLGALSPTKLLAALQSTLPGLLRPAIQVTTSWHVRAPFDSLFNSGGSTQTSVSIARRLFKNAVVLPTIPVGGATTINVNPTLQYTRAQLLSALQSAETTLTTLNSVAGVAGIGSCAAVIDNLSGDLADAVDPPNTGPSLTTILDDAWNNGQPVIGVSTAVTGLGIPFLDMVPVCIEKVNGQYIAHLTSFGSCIINGPGAFRAALRNS